MAYIIINWLTQREHCNTRELPVGQTGESQTGRVIARRDLIGHAPRDITDDNLFSLHDFARALLLRIQLQIDNRLFSGIERAQRFGITRSASLFVRGLQFVIRIGGQIVEMKDAVFLGNERTDL